MTVLLDTHVLIWLVEGLVDLPEESVAMLEEAAASDGLAVSAITFWEVALLHVRDRISLSRPVSEWRRRVLAAPGVLEAPVTGDIGIEAVRLPGVLHPDPADRLLVATARMEGWSLATRDRRLLDYSAAGHVNAVAV